MTLQEEVQLLRAENAELKGRIAQLEAQLAQNSHNSSKPPSSDGFKRPPKNQTKSLRKATGKKSGGQPEHPAHNLAWNEQPDRQLQHHPTRCFKCQTSLNQSPALPGPARQVLDLPAEIKLETIEHQVYTKACPNCHSFTTAPFPPEASHSLQYGPKVRALAVYLNQVQLILTPALAKCSVSFSA